MTKIELGLVNYQAILNWRTERAMIVQTFLSLAYVGGTT